MHIIIYTRVRLFSRGIFYQRNFFFIVALSFVHSDALNLNVLLKQISKLNVNICRSPFVKFDVYIPESTRRAVVVPSQCEVSSSLKKRRAIFFRNVSSSQRSRRNN